MGMNSCEPGSQRLEGTEGGAALTQLFCPSDHVGQSGHSLGSLGNSL